MVSADLAPVHCRGTAVDAYVGLGANLGDRRGSIEAAVDAIAALLTGTTLVASSSLYESLRRGRPMAAPYLNAVVHLRTSLGGHTLLRELLAIEARHGRTRSHRNAPRTLDLDLLILGDVVSSDAELTLPHPRLHERAFVLAPLAELDPQLDVPGFGKVATLLADVAGQAVVRWQDRIASGGVVTGATRSA